MKIVRLSKDKFKHLVNFFENNYGSKYSLSNKKHFNWLFNNYLNKSKKNYTAYIALIDNKIVGFYAWIPVKYQFFGKITKCNYQMNLMIDNNYRNLGIGYYLLKKVENIKSEIAISLNIGSEGERLISRMNWIIKDLQRYIHILNIQNLNAYLKKKIIFKKLNYKFSNIKKFHSKINYKFVKLKRTNNKLDYFIKKVNKKYPITTFRDSKYVQWRWFDHPYINYHVFCTSFNNEYVSLSVLRIENDKNLKIGRIVDFLSLKESEYFTISKIIDFFYKKNCDLIDYFSSTNYHKDSFIKSGFLNEKNIKNNFIPLVFNPPDNRKKLNFTFKVFNNELSNNNVLKNIYVNKSDADGDRFNKF